MQIDIANAAISGVNTAAIAVALYLARDTIKDMRARIERIEEWIFRRANGHHKE